MVPTLSRSGNLLAGSDPQGRRHTLPWSL